MNEFKIGSMILREKGKKIHSYLITKIFVAHITVYSFDDEKYIDFGRNELEERLKHKLPGNCWRIVNDGKFT